MKELEKFNENSTECSILANIDTRDKWELGDKPPLEYFKRLGEFNRCPAPYSHYSISQEGVVIGDRYKRPIKEFVNNCGYKIVNVTTDSGKKTSIPVHRLVALTYFDNKRGFEEVDHIDDNRLNNVAWNLKLITRKDNLNKEHRRKLMKNVAGNGRSVKKVNDDGTFQEYKSIKQAAEANELSNTSVSGSAAGHLHLNKPFHFVFVSKEK